MAAMRQAVIAGYRHYLVASTPEEKVMAAVTKINERHRILLSPEAEGDLGAYVRTEAGPGDKPLDVVSGGRVLPRPPRGGPAPHPDRELA
jgi:hypothetical protein